MQYILNGLRLPLNQSGKKQCKKEPFPVIIPIIIYHGKESWKYRRFRDYYGRLPGELTEYIPGFKYLILDLQGTHSPEQLDDLFQQYQLKTALIVEKYIFHPEKLTFFLEKFFDLCQIYNEQEIMEFINATLIYIFSVVDDNIQDQIYQIILKNENGGAIMNLLEKREKEAYNKGKLEGKLDTAVNLIKDGADLTLVKKWTGISIKQLQKIKNNLK